MFFNNKEKTPNTEKKARKTLREILELVRKYPVKSGLRFYSTAGKWTDEETFLPTK